MHKKYTYKDGKRFGPYYYETKRINGKVVTTYLGPEHKNNFFSEYKALLIIYILSFTIALSSVPMSFTGYASLDIKAQYNLGEQIEGEINLNILEGELIPADSLITITYENISKEIILSDIVEESPVNGSFYAKDIVLSGEGIGYGLIGKIKEHPYVDFKVSILDKKETNDNKITSEEPNINSEENGIPEEPETIEETNEENNETNTENKEETNNQEESNLQNEEETVINEANTESEEQNEQAEEQTTITGSSISEQYISGKTSKDEPFKYIINEDETAEIVPDSVYYNSKQLSDDEIKLKINNNEITVSTNYYIENEGYGEKYLGKNDKRLSIDISKLELIATESSEISVTIMYKNEKILEAHKDIEVIKPKNESIEEKTPEIELNISQINESEIENITKINQSIGNLTENNITLQNITNFTEIAINETTVNVTQFTAVIGQPVRWIKTIAIDLNESVNLVVEIPIEAENITLDKIDLNEYAEIKGISIEDLEITESEIPTEQPQVENITARITGSASANIDLNNDLLYKILRFLRLTGKVIDENQKEKVQEVSIELNKTDFGVEVEYYTEAPQATEEISSSTSKKVLVSSPENLHYENVLIFTNISDNLRLTDQSNIIIEWIENNSRLEIFSINDSNNDGNYDYVQWIAPHLSNQSFNIIVIINAQHLNQTREFISNIYNETKELDNIWSETIPNGHYVRVTFERNLTSEKDITVYPRASNGTNISEVSIKIYVKNSNETIAEFSNLAENSYNKVLLTNLNQSQDTFDLEIVNGNLEFDHIIDPNQGPDVFNLTSPINGSSTTIRSVNISMFINDTDGAVAGSSGNNSLFYIDTSTTFTNEHLVYVDDEFSFPRDSYFNYSIPPLKYDPTGMIILYHFDNNSHYNENKTRVTDFATGKFNGTVTSAEGERQKSITGVGRALRTNFSQIITIPDDPLLNSPFYTGQITIAFWFNLTTNETINNFPAVLEKVSGNSTNRDYRIEFLNTTFKKLSFNTANGTASESITTGKSFANSTWYHYAVTYTNVTGNMSTYVNGIPDSSRTATAKNLLMDSNADLRIGRSSGANSFVPGLFDDIVIYNRTLNSSEVLDMYRLREGTYYLRVNSTDSLGASNSSPIYTFSVDLTNPGLTLNDSSNASSFSSATSVSFNWTAIDYIDTSLNCNLTIDNAVNKSNIASANNTMINVSVSGFSVTDHYWNVTCLDDAGNKNISQTRTFTITESSDTQNPNVSFVNPTPSSGSIQTGNSIFVNVSTSDSNNVSTFIDFGNSIIGLWRMDEYNSTSVHDYLGKINGTINGNAQVNTSGNFNSSFSFDGNGDFINLGDPLSGGSSKLNVLNNFTIVVWIKPFTLGGTVLSREDSNVVQNFQYTFGINDSGNIFAGSSSIQTSSLQVSANTWSQIAITVNGTNSRVYKNGINSSIFTFTSNNLDGGNVVIGDAGELSDDYFNGSIDNIIFFNRTLSLTEIEALYDNASSKYAQINYTNLASGNHLFKAYSQDLSGNINSTELRSVTVDTILPVINFTSPTPANGSSLSVNSMVVNVSASDLNNVSSFIDMDNSLVSWWRMDDLNSSGGVVDYTGINNGTATGGAVQNNSGKLGKSFSFDGSSGYIDTVDLNWDCTTISLPNFTGAMWIYPESLSSSPEMFDGVQNTYFLMGSLTTTDIVFSSYNGSSDFLCSKTHGISLNQWHLVVWSNNGTAINLYVNGTSVGSCSNLGWGSVAGLCKTINIGADGDRGENFFDGSIDDAMIFNRSLSVEEINALYANTSSKYYSNNFTSLTEGNHNFKAYAQDIAGNVNFTELRTVNINTNPTPYNGTALILNSTLGLNRTLENLNVRTTLLDQNNNSMNVTVRWYNNSIQHLVFEYNSSYSNGTTFIATLGHQNTTKGQNWSVGLTINDGFSSLSVNSSNLTILNSLPNATQTSPLNGSITLNRSTQIFTWVMSDDDGDSILTNRINISLVASSTCTDSSFDGTDIYEPEELGSFSMSTMFLTFRCLSDNNDYYKWSVAASEDGTNYGSYSAPFNLSVQAYLNTIMNISSIEFGNLNYLATNDTVDNSPNPLIIINQGNSLINIFMEATNLWRSVTNPSTYYQAKVANVTTNGISENGSFSWASSQTSYTNVLLTTNISSDSPLITNLNYSDSTDSAEVDVNVTVPSGEEPGARSSTITFTIVLGSGDTY